MKRFARCISLWALILWPALSFACDCPERSFEERFEAANIVLRAHVVSVSNNTHKGGYNIAVQVKESWKRSIEPYTTVHTLNSSCGVNFTPDRDYIIWAEKHHQTIRADKCLGALPVEEAAADLAYLGEGMPPSASPGMGKYFVLLLVLPLLGLAFVAFVVLRARKRYNR